MTPKSAISQRVLKQASDLIESIRFLRTEIDHAARIFALVEAGNNEEIVDKINAQERGYVETCIQVRRGLLTTGTLILCRAFDNHNCKTTISFKQTMALAKYSEVQSFFEHIEGSKKNFQDAFSKWESLTTHVSAGALSKLNSILKASPQEQRHLLKEVRDQHGLQVVLKTLRDKVLAHNEPGKAQMLPKLLHNDARGLLGSGIDLVDYLSSATGTTSVSVQHTTDIWGQRGQVFWGKLSKS